MSKLNTCLEITALGLCGLAIAVLSGNVQAQSTGPTMPYTLTDLGTGSIVLSPTTVNLMSGNQGGGTFTSDGNGTITFQPNWIKP